MNLSDLKFEKIDNYDPLNSRAKSNGMVTEWVARNEWGNAVAFYKSRHRAQEVMDWIVKENEKQLSPNTGSIRMPQE